MKFLNLLLLLVTYQIYGLDRENIITYSHQNKVQKVLPVNTNKGPMLISTDGSNVYIWNKSELLEKRKISDGQITSLQIQNTQKGLHILAVAGENIHILETDILGNKITEDFQNESGLNIEFIGFKLQMHQYTCFWLLVTACSAFIASKKYHNI